MVGSCFLSPSCLIRETKEKAPSYAGHSPALLRRVIIWSASPSPRTSFLYFWHRILPSLLQSQIQVVVQDSMVQIIRKGETEQTTGEYLKILNEKKKEKKSLSQVNPLHSPQRHLPSSGVPSLRCALRPQSLLASPVRDFPRPSRRTKGDPGNGCFSSANLSLGSHLIYHMTF